MDRQKLKYFYILYSNTYNDLTYKKKTVLSRGFTCKVVVVSDCFNYKLGLFDSAVLLSNMVQNQFRHIQKKPLHLFSLCICCFSSSNYNYTVETVLPSVCNVSYHGLISRDESITKFSIVVHSLSQLKLHPSSFM